MNYVNAKPDPTTLSHNVGEMIWYELLQCNIETTQPILHPATMPYLSLLAGLTRSNRPYSASVEVMALSPNLILKTLLKAV